MNADEISSPQFWLLVGALYFNQNWWLIATLVMWHEIRCGRLA